MVFAHLKSERFFTWISLASFFSPSLSIHLFLLETKHTLTQSASKRKKKMLTLENGKNKCKGERTVCG